MGTKNKEINTIDIELLEMELENEIKDSENVEEYRKIIRAALGIWLKNLKNGTIKLNSVSDLKVLIEADTMLKNLEDK
ncbi:MAG: hypothetical protein RR554_11445 [Vagococcus sp.]|jgi:hypothetical protein|uniref:Uncharacterized protein n=1 Tax=Carnobacterium maltaromaticum TaxID=2751 RepID=A0AAW9JZJ8_CARML|nr:hypothetical protein [Carnobacterium maltaromaticum]MCI1842353.1 hypothetical protein [Lactococcus lactis]MDT1944344.1 hypothetical protein [Carnobacterium maltaromaticum]MDT1997934.1 hypothetical protein [Carnobacterium maltaromaticum]MDZ5758071.1 hypothetical protein [Carnobacterium maltaromaticum]TFJ56886.1 hypothetical protein CKN96_10565 [Carnobacterium maltaromaticum]